MNHLPYIVASYAVFVLTGVAVAMSGIVRLRGATRRLAALDTRRAARGAEP